MRIDKQLVKLVCKLEKCIGEQCYNPNSYNGWLDEEGCSFRYPVSYCRTVDDYNEHKLTKTKGEIDFIDIDCIDTIKYAFGSNHLYIGVGIVEILRKLEEYFELDFDKLIQDRIDKKKLNIEKMLESHESSLDQTIMFRDEGPKPETGADKIRQIREANEEAHRERVRKMKEENSSDKRVSQETVKDGVRIEKTSENNPRESSLDQTIMFRDEGPKPETGADKIRQIREANEKAHRERVRKMKEETGGKRVSQETEKDSARIEKTTENVLQESSLDRTNLFRDEGPKPETGADKIRQIREANEKAHRERVRKMKGSFRTIAVSNLETGNDYHKKINSKTTKVKNKQKSSSIIRRVKVIYRGDRCPSCGQPNSIDKLIKVYDYNDNVLTILARVCSCGEIYLTRRLKKMLPVGVDYEMVRGYPFSTTYTKPKHLPRTSNGESNNLHKCSKCGKRKLLFSNKGMCWECYKEYMNAMYD